MAYDSPTGLVTDPIIERTSQLPGTSTGTAPTYQSGMDFAWGTQAPTTPLSTSDQLKASLTQQGYSPDAAATLAAKLLSQYSATSTTNYNTGGGGGGSYDIGGITAPTATAQVAAAPTPVGPLTLADVGGFGSGIPIGSTTPTTREVTPDELVQNRLQGLLDSNSPYIRNARLAGVQYANARGQLGSSFAAGAAQKSAIEAGLPIATADAQAFRDAATQNLNALNNFALANLQRATSLDTALIDSNTSIHIANMDASIRVSLANLDAATRINISNLDAKTQTNIANLSSQTQMALQAAQSQLQLTMQGRELTHDTEIEQMKQTGAINLTMLDGAIREKLAHLAIDGEIQVANLNNEQQLELETTLHGYDMEKQQQDYSNLRVSQRAELAAGAQTDYLNYLAGFSDTDMDSAAAARLQADAWNFLVARFQLINGLYPELAPITPTKG
jgi:hypothetical protein